jgi:hypothetical protein
MFMAPLGAPILATTGTLLKCNLRKFRDSAEVRGVEAASRVGERVRRSPAAEPVRRSAIGASRRAAPLLALLALVACERSERVSDATAPAQTSPAVGVVPAPPPANGRLTTAAPAPAASAPEREPSATSDPEAPRALEAAIASEEASDAELMAAIAQAAGDPRAAPSLEALVDDDTRDDGVRAHAMVALANLDADALGAMLAGLDPVQIGSALATVREIPFAQTEAFFRALLASGVPFEVKSDAVAALGDSSPDAGSLLVELAAGAADPALRAAAVDAVVFMPEPGAIPAALLERLPREPDPEVRASLYRVLAGSSRVLATSVDPAETLRTVLAEREPATRLEGYRYVAVLLRAEGDPTLADPFDHSMVPWLEREAERGATRNARRSAVEALGLAPTARAAEALRRLASGPDPEVAEAAGAALGPR